MRHLGKTPPFRGPHGEHVPGSIAKVEYLRLGGIDQWVMMRGESVTNPPLIILHGGPGMTEMRFFRSFNAALEKSFTVVHWDQRGTGKSFSRKIPRASMTVEQFIRDLDELVEEVCKRLGTDKVTLYGHSWGSALGVLYAARFPGKVAAYVGTGQYGNAREAEEASYAFAVAEAKRLGDDKILTKLYRIGPPPYTRKSLMTERMCLQRMEGLDVATMWNAGRALFGRPESSILDVPNFVRGFRFSLDTMWAEVSNLNLIKAVPSLQMPVFFFLGRRDHWVPPETSVAYFDVLMAPSKKLLWFKKSGHQVFTDEPAKFNAAMVDLVRPVVVAPPSAVRHDDRAAPNLAST